jgi:hypothetical protein
MNLKKGLALVFVCAILTACSKYTFQDIYRYPCQDPANWQTPECLPPNCEAFDICTKDVLADTPLFKGKDETIFE